LDSPVSTQPADPLPPWLASQPLSPAMPTAAPHSTRALAAVIEPLAPARYRVQFTASTELRDKLERLRALMRASVPDGDLATIIDRRDAILAPRPGGGPTGRQRTGRRPV